MNLRTEARAHDDLLARRLDHLVPLLLDETAIDCWLLIGREYAEDPVLATMLPAEWLSARRRTILILTPSERISVSRYPVGDLFAAAWDPVEEPDQWRRLVEILTEIDPKRIGIGVSPDQAHADGLTASEYKSLTNALPEYLASRLIPADQLGIRWLETRLPEEEAILAAAARTAHDILRQGLSTNAIAPGQTTTDDLAWWYRQTVADAGIESWFHPSVSVQRVTPQGNNIICPGDLVHVDFGIVHQGLCTDQQEHAYVLDRGETSAPQGLQDGLRHANRVQEILLNQFVEGSTGNEILAASLTQTRAEGLDATIYTHSIGFHGHGAGMTIGLWDQQSAIAGPGEHPLHRDTAYSIELMVRSPVHEWDNAIVQFMVEQDAWFDGVSCEWLDGRQEELWLI